MCFIIKYMCLIIKHTTSELKIRFQVRRNTKLELSIQNTFFSKMRAGTYSLTFTTLDETKKTEITYMKIN